MTCATKKILLILAGITALLASLPSFGQIAMKISLPQKNFLLYEPIYVRLDLRNVSGHPIVFGQSEKLAGELNFEIRSRNTSSYIPLISGKKPSPKGIILQPGVVKSFTCNLTQFYKLFQQGSYIMHALISHPRMPSAYRSNNVTFTITGGKKIWQATVGIPEDILQETPGKKDILTRKYSVISYHDGRRNLYILMIENDKKVFCLRHLGYDLGNMLRPQCAVDNLSRMHVLVAGSPKVFSYCIFDVNGKLVSSEVRLKTRTVPHLAINKELGTVVLSGGRKAQKDKDYEEIKDIPFLKGVFENKKRSLTQRPSTLFDDIDEPVPSASAPGGGKK